MNHDGLLEHDGFYIKVFTEPGEEGWTCSVTFERKSDFDQQKSLIRSVRHRLDGVYATSGDAVAAARSYSVQAIEAGQVDL